MKDFSEEEILQRKEAIARFMGAIPKKHYRGRIYWQFFDKDGLIRREKTVKNMEYNTSWSWIMPVVLKLNSVKCKDIRISFEEEGLCVCRIYFQDLLGDDEAQFEKGNYEPAIMNVFLAVSDYCLTQTNKL